MKKSTITKEQFILALENSKNFEELASKLQRSKNSIQSLFKKFNIATPAGFYSVKGRTWTNERKAIMSRRMSGCNNPFFNKKHSEATKQKMRNNHADFSGDNNPFKKACQQNPNLIKDLSNQKIKFWDAKSLEEKYKIHKKVVFGDISKNFWNRIVSNAKARNIEILISPEEAWDLFNKQNQKCALSGVQLNLKTCYEITASLDRINSCKPYSKDNIQWVHKSINLMKGSLDQTDFINICRSVTYYNEYQPKASN